MAVLPEREEVAAMERHLQCLDEDKVRLQLLNTVGNGHEEMEYVLFFSMVVRKLFFCIRCRIEDVPDENDNEHDTIRLCKYFLGNDLSSDMEPNNYNRYIFNIFIPSVDIF